MLDEEEFSRWREAAASSLRMVGIAREAGEHHHACFHAGQASQQALKALLHGAGEPGRAFGHNLAALVEAATDVVGGGPGDSVLDAIARLSRHYLPTRYPDAVPAGTPAQHYRRADADQAEVDAGLVMAFVDAAWRGSGR